MVHRIDRILKHPVFSYRPDISNNQLKSVADYIEVIIAYRWMIFAAVCIVGMLMGAVVLQSKLASPDSALIPPLYTSSARLIMSANPRSDVIAENNMNYIGVNVVGVDSITLTREVLRSPMVIDPIIERFRFAERFSVPPNKKRLLRNIFLGRMTIAADTRTRLDPVVTVGYSDSTPMMAKQTTDTLLENLRASLIEFDQMRYRNNLSSMKAQLDDISGQMAAIENRMVVVQRTIDAQLANRSTADVIGQHMNENETLRRKYKSLEQLYASLSSRYELAKVKSESSGSAPFYVIAYPELAEEKTMMGLKKLLVISIGGTGIAAMFLSILYHLLFTMYAPKLLRVMKERYRERGGSARKRS